MLTSWYPVGWMPIIDEFKAFALYKVIIQVVMLHEICVFTMNAGDISFESLLKPLLPT